MRKLSFLLACVLALVLTGCQSSRQSETTGPASDLRGTESSESIHVTLPGSNLLETQKGESLSFGAQDQLRIGYNMDINGVRYVTNAEDLPDYAKFEKYDEAWFQDHALVLVTETVSSGSIQVSIGSISVEDGTAAVTLLHERQGENGTMDMATWLIWAEVDAGLDYRWTLVNPAMQSDAEKY